MKSDGVNSPNSSTNGEPTLRDLMTQGKRMLKAMRKAVREAALVHKHAGVPMVIWEDGKVKEISADEFLRRNRNGSKKRKPRR